MQHSLFSFPFFSEDDIRALENMVTTCPSYPKYNIFSKDEDVYIEVAVTGFSNDEIEIIKETGKLKITAKRKDELEDVEYHVHNLSKKEFELKFTIKDSFKIENAKIENGLLTIKLIKDESKVERIMIE